MTIGAAAHRGRRAAGFTIVEILVVVALLIVIISLVIGAVVKGRRAAAGSAAAITVASIKTAVESFRREFGFQPPLIKDQAGGILPAPTPAAGVYKTVGSIKQLYVYQPGPDAGEPKKDLDALRRATPPTIPPNWSVNSGYAGADKAPMSDFYDLRYSTVSLPVYLLGACEEKGKLEWQVPLDGVSGPGFVTPNRDGSFAIPEALKKAKVANSSVNPGKTFGALFDATKGGAKVVISGDMYEFKDSSGRPFRYYVWVRGDPVTGLTQKPADRRIPKVVLESASGGDRGKPLDARAPNPAMGTATYAIVHPGADGLFGDEDYETIGGALRRAIGSPADELSARLQACSDNIVEFGG